MLPKPEQIMERRMKNVGNRAITEVLIKWKGTDMSDNSLEYLWELHAKYPYLKGHNFVVFHCHRCLVDKVF